jgi:hypothetical protein
LSHLVNADSNAEPFALFALLTAQPL